LTELRKEPVHNAVILHENKQYYPTAQDVYGPDVETLVQEEDAQPLSEPIIAPVKVRKWTVEEKDMPETRFDKGFVRQLRNLIVLLTVRKISS
jgi:116 kDa U5 small nuclear ribonucleoprotein component